MKRYGGTDNLGNFGGFMSRMGRSLRKNEAAIDIPLTLNMRPFVHPEAKDITLDGCDSYKLFGMSEHFGSLSGGHYTSKAQDIDSEEWFSQNDS